MIPKMNPAPTMRRAVPVLPMRPRAHPIAGHLCRSYPVGRQNFLRACQGEEMGLHIRTHAPLPANVRANLITTMSSLDGETEAAIPFVRADDLTLTCGLTPARPGLHSFRAEFSLNEGTSWLGDTVPDAWVLVDPPQVDGLRIYTLIPSVSGTIADWQIDLKRILAMGFNAVHLLPITTLDTSESPYSARDLFTIDPSYITGADESDPLSEFDEFVEEARTLGIRLGFDLVLNHIGVTSTLATRSPDWIVPDENQADGFKRAGYWADQEWHTWKDLVLINYEHPSEAVRGEIWAYMIDYALFWANYASVTGGFVRLDNLHSSDPNFVKALMEALHAEYPEVAILAEYFTDDSTLLNTVPQWGLNLVLATPWNFKFAPQLRDYLKYVHRSSGQIRYFMPITTHDTGSPAQEFGTAISTVPRYVAAALMGTGATGIPQGVEYGESERIDFIGRQSKILYQAEPRFAEFFRQTNVILAENPAFRHGGNCTFVDGDDPAVIAAFREDKGSEIFGFLVACNFDTRDPQRIAVDLSHLLGGEGPFPCRELLSGETRTIPHAHLELLLPPCGAQVLEFLRSSPLVS